ncbi:hypothetical protein H6G51_16265 [Limnothrix sp. FACHB-708]|uniref:hypothetical protein n=1 Tax=unclassified Limnothrix TaxID=2632864 RepID=UPI0016879834|nr:MULTISPECIES: hypothetical protein [unclassified Limnothrix]MBD2554839.1 hypothetical protein [Limnothrix sp. FACHB-708]MBD2592046.1 hypothetical protein [Limnothrix sp. FACHB-406]
MNSNLDSVPGALQAQLLGQLLDVAKELDPTTTPDQSRSPEPIELGATQLEPIEIDQAIEQALAAHAFDPADLLEGDFSALADPAINPAPARSLSPSDLSVANPMLELDAMPVVDQRYHALLKQRLILEASQRPPLFPWESSEAALDYRDTYEDAPSIAQVPQNPWLRQFQQLNLPTNLPADLAERLLAACQTVAAQALKEGVALMQAVDELFPDQDRLLNAQASVVLRWATAVRTGAANRFPMEYVEYDRANPQQQMTIALLAARELLNRLTLELSAKTPQVTQEWLADGGALRIEAHYIPQADRPALNLTLRLPGTGTATLNGPQASVQAAGEGLLRLSMRNVKPGDRYRLSVAQVGETELPPLTFTILVR